MRDIEPARWAGLSKTETIQLQLAKRGRIVNRKQVEALSVLAELSDRLTLTQLGDSTVEYATDLVVKVDGGVRVDVGIDGGVGLA